MYTFVHLARNQLSPSRVMFFGAATAQRNREFAVEELPVILVIEDDEGIQSVVEDALTEGGFAPAIAASGEEAVTLLKGRLINYRALVTDIGLPGKIDGWEVAEQARQIDPKFPIVYMSGAHAEDIIGLPQERPAHPLGVGCQFVERS